MVQVGDIKLTVKEVLKRYPGLLPPAHQDLIHVFLSYQQGERDSETAQAFYNAMLGMPIGEHGDHMAVFWDVKSLREGKQFDSSFMRAMLQSLVVTPLITPNALHRMMDVKGLIHQDNVLLEWTLALMLAKLDGYPVVSVMPIFSGSVSTGRGWQKACQAVVLRTYPCAPIDILTDLGHRGEGWNTHCRRSLCRGGAEQPA